MIENVIPFPGTYAPQLPDDTPEIPLQDPNPNGLVGIITSEPPEVQWWMNTEVKVVTSVDEIYQRMLERIDQDVREHRRELRETQESFRREMREMHEQYRQEAREREERLTAITQEIKTEIRELRSEIKQDISDIRADVRETERHVRALTIGTLATMIIGFIGVIVAVAVK